MKRILLSTLLAAPMFADYADIHGLKLYYEIHGDAKNPPLVLLHGGGSTIETSFGQVLPMLAKTHRVIAFEQQGHGRTTDVAGRPFTFEQSADDAAELLKQLQVEQADFYGYSNGGSIAMQIAIRHPKLVRRLVVASAMYRRDGLPPQFWEGMRHAKLSDMPKELKEAYLAVAPNPENLQSFHDKCVARMLGFKDWPDALLRSIEAPTLVMAGDRDVVTVEHVLAMYRLFPKGEVAILPGTDHMQFVTRGEWQVAMIEAFLGER
ncbi:MAG TPA: alpha/beta hydrolase [Thermoanaerobaculia bacterium]|nr:alpha/beta hydrolase [Thermoanaerobaculia bacterium]